MLQTTQVSQENGNAGMETENLHGQAVQKMRKAAYRSSAISFCGEAFGSAASSGVSFLAFSYALCAFFPKPANVSSSTWIAAAATFSSRCSTRDVPGMGKMTGDRCNNHTRASCEGEILSFAAFRSSSLP